MSIMIRVGFLIVLVSAVLDTAVAKDPNEVKRHFTTPTILSVEVPTNATYTNGAELSFDINFSEPVNITGSPQLSLTIGSTTVLADFDEGNGTSTLSFVYTVQTGDLDQDGIEIASLNLNGGTIQDLLGDDANLTLNNVEDLTGVRVDAVIPVVTSVEVPSDGTYREGESLNFTINLDDVVFVFGLAPQLIIDIGGSSVNATYTGGLFGTNLTFSYTVLAGQEDTDGIEIVSISGGSITDQAGNNADRTLNNIQDPSGVLVDAVGPVITSVSGPTDGTYGINDDLIFSVNFDEQVTVSGSPQLFIQIGSSSINATLTGGSGTSSLTFEYTVQPGDEDTDGIAINALSLNGGTIEDALNNTASLTLNNVDDLSNVFIDGITPVVTSVNVPADDLYGTTDVLNFTVNFSEPVDVTGAPLLSVDIGSSAITASLTGGSGTASLTFQYIVQTGDEDIDGINVASLALNGGTVEDAVGNDANLTLNNIDNTSDVLVDGILPTILSVAVPTNDIYGADDLLSFDIEFSEVVVVTGTPQLSITIGSSTVNANFSGGSNSSTLSFQYMVLIGENDTDGIDVNALGLNGGTISDLADNNADLTLNNVADPSGVLVDGLEPIITSVDVPPDGTYSGTQTLNFQVNFNEPVNGTGSPELSFIIGATTVQASLSGGSGTTTLTFSYIVQTGEQDLDGITVTSLDLNGGTIEDIAGTDADLTLNNVADASNVFVDAIPPVVNAVSVPADDTYAIDEQLSFTVSFDKNVNVGGSPILSVVIGTTTVNASFASGSGSQDLIFTYTVLDGEVDTDGIAIVSLGLNSGSIQDLIGNHADLTLNNVADASGVLVDGIAPTITSVNVPADDTYIILETLNFTVNFDDVVNVSGNPLLSIGIGGSTATAALTGGSGTASLTFEYIVQTGDEDSDGISVTSLLLNGGTIEDAVSNEANLTLNNVANASAVLVDGVRPLGTISTSASNATNENPIPIQIDFSESVIGLISTDVDVNGGSIANFSGTGDLYTFDLIPSGEGLITVDIAEGVATDIPGNDNLVSAQLQITSDVSAPTGYTVSMDLNGETAINSLNQSSINFTITGGEVGAVLTYEFEATDGTMIVGTENVTSTNQTFTNSGTGYDLSSLVDGPITLTIRLTDPADNTGGDAITNENKDTTPPTGYSIQWSDNFISAAEANTTTFILNNGEENAILEYSVTSSGGSSIGPFTVSMDATNAQTITVDVSMLEDGTLTIEGTLTDTESNEGTTVSDNTLLDQSAPIFISVTDNEDGNYRADESITLIADMGETGLSISGDVSVFDTDFGMSVAFTDQTDGTYSLTTNALDLSGGMMEGAAIAVTITATDPAGNSASDNSLALLLDKTVPTGYAVVLDELRYGLNNQESASFTISGGEIGTSYQYELTSNGGSGMVNGNGSVTNTSQQISGIDISNLIDGDLLLSVTLTDISGNAGAAATFGDSEKITGPPVITSAQVFTVDENASNGTSIGTVSASDPAGLPLTDWAILSGNDAGIFSLDQTSGVLTILDNSVLDFEIASSYNLSLTVSNGFVSSASESVTVNLNDLNDNAPTVDPSQSFSVNENAAASLVVGTITASDADAGTTFSAWSIVSGNEDGILTLDPSSGELSIANNTLLDFERIQSISIRVNVSDGANTSADETVVITILDENDNVPVVTPNQTFIVPTPLTTLTSFGTILATDPDGNTAFSNWTIVSGNDASFFSLDATTGDLGLTTTTGISELSYTLIVSVSDGLNTSQPASISILIGDAVAPEVVLSSSVPTATNVSTQSFTATFSETVIGFEVNDISVSNGTVANLSENSSLVYTFDVTPADEGTVEVSIPAGVLTDNFLNPNDGSNTISFIYDITPPTATITSNNGPLTNQSVSIVSIAFNELVEGLTTQELGGSNVAFDNLEFANGTYTLTSTSVEGVVEVILEEATVLDLAGNPNVEAAFTWTIDQTPPSGYQLNILDEVINTLNQDNLRFEILDGEEGSTYAYTVASVDPIQGSGQLDDLQNQIIDGIDVASLSDGLLEISLILSDEAGNQGLPVLGEVLKNTRDEIPQGFNPDLEPWVIPGIENFPDNKVVIFNRYGNRVWEVEGYDNLDNIWRGNANVSGVIGSGGVPDGTYFYVLEFTDGAFPSKSGFVIIKR